MEVVVITGLSGAGKSQAVNCMEDMGYYCIDNMPPGLIKDFIKLTGQNKMKIDKAAFVIDIRGGEFFDDMRTVLAELKESIPSMKTLFLEASDEILIRRYKETRRAHPLATDGGNVPEGIVRERKRLYPVRKMSDYIIDTSEMKAADLYREIHSLLFPDQEDRDFSIMVTSFGFKYGIPLDADMVFDVRFIPNPFYLASMRNLTGNSKKVQEYVMKFPEASIFLNRVKEMIIDLIPLYIREGKRHLVLSFGCTGGHHRSVTMANILSEDLLDKGIKVVTTHRDL
ncbi:MAG: RNase adapter RapZ [Anaerovoracaceae bacterium]|jgi:UPF0042 nucleotide-binding protein